MNLAPVQSTSSFSMHGYIPCLIGSWVSLYLVPFLSVVATLSILVCISNSTFLFVGLHKWHSFLSIDFTHTANILANTFWLIQGCSDCWIVPPACAGSQDRHPLFHRELGRSTFSILNLYLFVLLRKSAACTELFTSLEAISHITFLERRCIFFNPGLFLTCCISLYL